MRAFAGNPAGIRLIFLHDYYMIPRNDQKEKHPMTTPDDGHHPVPCALCGAELCGADCMDEHRQGCEEPEEKLCAQCGAGHHLDEDLCDGCEAQRLSGRTA